MRSFFVQNKWLFFLAIAIIILTSIPYWLGFQSQDLDNQFSGLVIGVEDGNSYLAKMVLGSSGDWLFTTPYTAYPQTGFFAFFPYLLLGKLASFPEQRLQLVMIFHLFRFLGIFVLIRETFLFSELFVKEKKTSILVTILLLLGGGLGWIQLIFPQLTQERVPLEFYSPETFGFLSVFSLPHLLFGRAFLYQSFRKILNIEVAENPPLNNIIGGGISLLISGIFQPLNIFIGWAVTGAFFLFRIIKTKNFLKYLKRFFIWIIPSSPLFFYNFFSFLFDPYLSVWEEQNRIISPPVWDYLFAYGLGIIIIFLLLRSEYNKNIFNKAFLNIWLLLIPILVYFPVNLQRRLAEGVWICFCIYIAVFLQSQKKFIVRVAIIAILLLSNLIFELGTFQLVLKKEPPVYIAGSLLDLGKNLEGKVNKGDVVLAPYQESNILPTLLPVKVMIGHGPESKNLVELSTKVDQFYSGKLRDAELHEMLTSFNIRYILIPNEYSLQNLMHYYSLDQYELIFENYNYSVLKIDE